jgi:uncharacterized protein
MNTKLFVNMPVKDIQKTNAFFKALGFEFDPRFSNEKATCMIINEDAYFMLLQEEFFKTFISTEICDARKQTEVLNCISRESKQLVNEFVDKAVRLGAVEIREAQDHGFMYGRSFHDLDGHIWEVLWMDVNAVPEQAQEQKIADPVM